MSYNKKIASIIIAVFFVAFNIIVFTLDFKHDNSFWIGYGFSWAAVIVAYIVILAVLKNDSISAMFLGMPFAYFTVVYVSIQIVFSLIAMAIPKFSTVALTVIEVILLAGYIIIILSVQMGRHTIQDNRSYVAQKQFYLKDMLSAVSSYKFYINDPVLSKQMSDLEETIRYSDPMSNERLAPLENKIGVKIQELGARLQGGDNSSAGMVVQELQGLFAERSRQCKMLK